MMRFYLVLVFILLSLTNQSLALETRRSHRFLRPMAMGGAFTAVADSKDTIAYNPAGLYQKKVDWSYDISLLGFGYNDNAMALKDGDIDFGETSSLASLPGERIYIEVPVMFSNSLFIPDCGWCGTYGGISADTWIEIAFPSQTIVPTLDLDIVGQGVFEYGIAFQIFGLYAGFNFKAVQRAGLVASVDLVSTSVYLDNEDYDGLIEEYGGDQPGTKFVVDFGLLYRFDHPWNIRIGLAAIDMFAMDIQDRSVSYGTIDYGSAGEVTQLNSVGIAFTIEKSEFEFTGSFDYLDYTYSYLASNSTSRRVALGFEVGYGKRADNSYIAAFQAGLRELKYFSAGMTLTLGALEFSTIRWTENFGTEDTELLDTRYMFLLSLSF